KSDSLSDWGGSFGGAVVKDKLFYYGAFERYMQAMWSVGPNTRTVPTDAMMGLDSTGSVVTNANLGPMLSTGTPFGTDSCGNTIYKGAIFDPNTGCVFVGNLIPTSMISHKTAQILQLYHQYYAPESSTLPTNDA